jgi:hypothetical protein
MPFLLWLLHSGTTDGRARTPPTARAGWTLLGSPRSRAGGGDGHGAVPTLDARSVGCVGLGLHGVLGDGGDSRQAWAPSWWALAAMGVGLLLLLLLSFTLAHLPASPPLVGVCV